MPSLFLRKIAVIKFPWLPSPPPPRTFRHAARYEGVLGTSLEIQVAAHAKSSGARAETAILAEISRLDAIFSAYNPQSELCRWQTSFEQEIAVSDELAEVLALARSWQTRTNGSFNPAVEAFTRVWKRAEARGEAVDERELEQIVAQVQAPLWELDAERQTARRSTRLPVTLNAIAKGFIIDRAAEVGAQIEGVEQVLVNIGGDIRHTGARKVVVSVADPRADAENATPASRIALRNQGIATSGGYRRGFLVRNRWFSHLIDPRSGWPVKEVQGVSIVAPDAVSADVLATAFSILSTPEALKLADLQSDIGVFLVERDGTRHSNAHWREQSL